MPFEIVEPASGLSRGLDPSEISVSRNGTLRIRQELLTEAEFGDLAVVMVDRKAGRIAIRPAEEGEKGYSIRPDKRSKSCSIRIGRAIRALGLDPCDYKGRLSPVAKDNLLVIDLADLYDPAESEEDEPGDGDEEGLCDDDEEEVDDDDDGAEDPEDPELEAEVERDIQEATRRVRGRR